MGTFGVKKSKAEKARRYIRQSSHIKQGDKSREKKRYYPLNKSGNIDEWQAMENLKEHAAQIGERKQREQERMEKQAY